SLFDALRSHSTSQWFRDLGTQQVRQLFTNAATPALQQVGHTLGGIMPASMSGILHGTLLDPANKGVDAADTTAKETKRPGDEVHALRGDMRALSGAPAPTGTADGGTGITLPAWDMNPATGGPMGDLLKSAGLGSGVIVDNWGGTGASSL